MIEQTAAKALTVTDIDGTQKGFLNVDIYEEWYSGEGQERTLLGTTKLSDTSLLQELGLIEYGDKQYVFGVEGDFVREKIHLSAYSPRQFS
jgi:hypothetical protein